MLRSIIKEIANKNILNIIKKKEVSMPLGRWCHKEYNNKCDTDIKADLANLDNGCIINTKKK